MNENFKNLTKVYKIYIYLNLSKKKIYIYLKWMYCFYATNKKRKVLINDYMLTRKLCT